MKNSENEEPKNEGKRLRKMKKKLIRKKMNDK